MKKIFFILSCSLSSLVSHSQITTNSQWTWMKGDSTVNQYGVYGIQGSSDPANKPGARYAACSWSSGSNFWLFGGSGYAASGSLAGIGLNDLWKYNSLTNRWTWIKGDSIPNPFGYYGTQGIASSANNPGGRDFAVSWVDLSGNLWLFGGQGNTGSFGGGGVLNDLWKYDSLTNQWIWINGDNTSDQSGVYGTLGITSPTNKPGARYGSMSWIDANGNFWLFGGFGYSSSSSGELNDLWKYDPVINQWTWMGGDNSSGLFGIYGTKGVASTTNKPGSRRYANTWVANNNLWLFGGRGYSASSQGYLNDLWKYDLTTNQWTWVSGDNIAAQNGIYGTPGIASISNKPGAREESAAWIDINGNLLLFGGYGYPSSGTYGGLNDLWKYDLTMNEWIWLKGDSLRNQVGVYGIIGVVSSTNKPGNRYVPSFWKDNNNDIWLLGGGSSLGYLNDLWKLGVYHGAYTWIGVTSTDWTVGSNWSGGVVPTASDNAIVPGGTPYSAMVPAGITVSCYTLTMKART